MEVNKGLKQLEQEIKELGLVIGEPSGKNGRILKKDYIKVLTTYNVIKKYGGVENAPMNLRFRLAFESPQLAFNYFDLKPAEQEVIWNSDKVWLTEKINGIRGTLIYNPKEKYSCFSREMSDRDYLYINYAERLFDEKVIDAPKAFAVDVEIQLKNRKVAEHLKRIGYEVDTDFKVVAALMMIDVSMFAQIKKEFTDLFRYKLLDVYYSINGGNIVKQSYSEREKHFDFMVLELQKCGLDIVRPQYCKEPNLKKAFHEGVMKSGGEGTIAVFIDKPCILDGTRARDEMIKIKRSLFAHQFDPNALTDTVDAFIVSIKRSKEFPSLISSMEVAVVTTEGKEKLVANIDAIPLSVRKNSEVSEGDVVEVSGSVWKDGMIQSPVVERLRLDKSKHECIPVC